jgi:hypothetical protein
MNKEWFEKDSKILNESALDYNKERKKADKVILVYRNRIKNNNENIKNFKEKLNSFEEDEEHSELRNRYSRAIATLEKDNDNLRQLISRIQGNLFKLSKVKLGKKKKIEEDAIAEPLLTTTDSDNEDEENLDKNLKVLENSNEQKPLSNLKKIVKNTREKILHTHENKLKDFTDLIRSREIFIKESENKITELKEKLETNSRILSSQKRLEIGRNIQKLKKSIETAKLDIKNYKTQKDNYIKKNKLKAYN